MSLIDVTVRTSRPVTLDQAEHAIRAAAAGALRGIVDATSDPVVSGDFVGQSASCIVDLTACVVINPTFVKFVAWFDNEYAYACRVVDLVVGTASR